MAHASKKSYLAIFGLLALLTALEVGVVYTGVSRKLLISALIGLAVTKAFMVGWFFMHLKSDTKTMKATVAIPFFFPALYAFVLIAEAAWRHFQ